VNKKEYGHHGMIINKLHDIQDSHGHKQELQEVTAIIAKVGLLLLLQRNKDTASFAMITDKQEKLSVILPVQQSYLVSLTVNGGINLVIYMLVMRQEMKPPRTLHIQCDAATISILVLI
jgi:hypothetical protein